MGINAFVKTLEGYYAKAPVLPVGGREFLVSIIPWLSLIFGILVIFASLSAFGMGVVSSPLVPFAGIMPFQIILAIALGFIQGVVMVLAFSYLRKRLLRGWMFLVWAQVISVIGSIVSLNLGNIVWGLIVTLVIFYFLFQIKPYYR